MIRDRRATLPCRLRKTRRVIRSGSLRKMICCPVRVRFRRAIRSLPAESCRRLLLGLLLQYVKLVCLLAPVSQTDETWLPQRADSIPRPSSATSPPLVRSWAASDISRVERVCLFFCSSG